jgi:hypothetical protein
MGVATQAAIQERVCDALGWSLKDVQSCSFASLRELVRVSHPELAALIADAIRSGSYINPGRKV